MAADSSRAPGACWARLADLVETDRAEILAAYEKSLEAASNPIVADPLSRRQVIANAGEILTDVVESVRAGRVRVDGRYKLLSWTIGETRADSALNPSDSLRAAVTLFETVVNALSRHVGSEVDLLPSFVLAVLALNESINVRIREATVAYTGYLLKQVHRAHVEERRRIARELHDRLGEGLSVALRQLELHELAAKDEPVRASLRNTVAQQAIAEAMQRLRSVVTDLRQEPVASLEKALVRHLDSIEGEDVRLRLRVSGDETWASRTALDESFLIIREAIRNAITHAEPTMVLIGVDLAPHELRAWVEDDGHGLNPTHGTESGGIGLASMRERAALLGGRVTVSSRPGHGTHVELLVPLSGHRDEPT